MPISSTWDARKTELELPEEIDLQVELANVGSRTLAILIDLAVGGLALFIVYALTMLLARNVADDWLTRLSSNALKMALMLLIFGLQWVYFNIFEWMWNGQTPGKRLLHLRVIKVDGSPVSGIDVLLRNLSRPIDTLGPMGLIGLLMIFVTRKAQRLGDLMGRTLVIHETKIDWSIFDPIESAAAASPGSAAVAGTAAPAARLTSAQWELLHRYLNRRDQFETEARRRLALALVECLMPAVKGTELERSPLSPEEWLVELARRT
ncbi:MAG TPA: RDD family protein [Candidatus Methylacidiphilales bacterium]|nr:RDD family protein [Candidatus Methylacidiphilales bacterium]